MISIGLACGLVCLVPAAATSARTWTNYTNVRDINDIVGQGDTLWIATTGGLVRLVIGGPPHKSRFTNADGLGGNNLSFVVLDSEGTVWTGGENGRLSHRRSDGTWDIFTFERENGQPLWLYSAAPGPDGFLWVGSDVGVHKFDTRRNGGEIKETYTRIGDWPDQSPVRDVLVYRDSIWLAGPAGAAMAKVADQSLLERFRWRTWMNLGPLTSIEGYRTDVVAGGERGFYVYHCPSEGVPLCGNWMSAELPISDADVLDLHAAVDTVWISTPQGLIWWESNSYGVVTIPSADAYNFSAVFRSPDGPLAIAQKGMGLWIRTDGWTEYAFNCLLDNATADIAVGLDGKIWCIHRFSGADYLEDGQWTTLPYVQIGTGNPGTSVAVASNGDVWLGSRGSGAFRVNPRSPLADTGWTQFGPDNSSLMFCFTVDCPTSKYTIVHDIAADHAGRVWFSNAESDSERVIAYYDNGCWGVLDARNGIVSRAPLPLYPFRDSILIGFEDIGLGKFRFTSELCAGGKPIPRTETMSILNSEHGLPSDNIRAIVVDRADSLWVGTNLGLSRYAIDQHKFFDVTLPADAGLTINALAVDASNTIWVGTTLGLVVLPPDGPAEYLNAANSDLVGDSVAAIAIDEPTGEMWIATAGGVSRTFAASPTAPSPDRVFAYPNPFAISPTGGEMVRFNAQAGSRVHIFTLDGRPVADIGIEDGWAWDGRTSKGDLVASGVYLFVVRGLDRDHGQGKLAVLRRR